MSFSVGEISKQFILLEFWAQNGTRFRFNDLSETVSVNLSEQLVVLMKIRGSGEDEITEVIQRSNVSASVVKLRRAFALMDVEHSGEIDVTIFRCVERLQFLLLFV